MSTEGFDEAVSLAELEAQAVVETIVASFGNEEVLMLTGESIRTLLAQVYVVGYSQSWINSNHVYGEAK